MSNDKNPLERLWKLQTMVNKLVLDGKRDPVGVAEILQKIVDGKLSESKPTPPILDLVPTVAVSATIGIFIAKEKFIINAERSAGVLISALNDNFKEWFLSGDGKIEDLIAQQLIRCHKLLRSSLDGPIITELGGEAKAETSLSTTFSLMEKQKHGEDGCLLKNGFANIFYIRDQTDVLRAVSVNWNGIGWQIEACFIGDSFGWFNGRQVFSYNS